jgi:hypothetical protein
MKKQAQLEKHKAKHNLDLAKEFRLTERNKYISDGFNNLLHYGTWGFGIYWTGNSIIPFAGEETKASLFIQLQQAIEVNAGNSLIVFGSLFFGATALLCLTVNRILSNKRIKRLGERVVYLEEQVDPGRTSSGLSEIGEHHQGD